MFHLKQKRMRFRPTPRAQNLLFPVGPLFTPPEACRRSFYISEPRKPLIKDSPKNILDANVCPNAGRGDDGQAERFTAAFTPLASRL